jgi:ribosomal protein S18 acetylase RimI-like enzyme
MEIHIRKATIQDVSMLTHIGKTVFSETFDEDNTEANMTEYLNASFGPKQQFEELNDSLNYIFFIEIEWNNALEEYLRNKCKDNERYNFFKETLVNPLNNRLVVAYSKLRYGSFEPFLKYTGTDTMELVRVYVLKEFQGAGIAQKVMQECLRVTREEFTTCKSIWLGVWEKNHRAITFYQKFNFEKVGSHEFVLGDDIQTDDVMELIL